MEYLKQVLDMCCKDCCAKRTDSGSSTQIIVPSSRKVSSKHGIATKSTFTYLAQPDFCIPVTNDKLTSSSPRTHRKQSAPPVMTRTVAIQPLSSYVPPDSMHKSLEPQIRIDEDVVPQNLNNNSMTFLDLPWKSNDSVSSAQSSLSPSHRPKSTPKRLSVAQIAATHSRRSSMSSFDISRDEVDSDMYDSGELTQDVNSNGELCFSIAYEQEREQLTVNILSAKDLWNPHNGIVLDSFVKVSIISSHKKKIAKVTTATQKGTANPVFDELFIIDNVVASNLESYAIKMTVFSLDKASRKKKLGVVIHQLNNGVMDTEDPGRRIWRHVYGDGANPMKGVQGNLMLTMCYLPTDSQLKINVTRASELVIREQDNKQYEGVYAKLALIAHGKVIRKEKTKLIQPSISNPVFDDMFTFTLPSGMIDQCWVIVSVNGKTAHGKRANIGYVSLGPPFFSTGSGLEQWTKMLSAPFTMVSKWHILSVWSKKDSSQNLNECNMF